MIIAIDGPSGTGKSTVARTVSEKLGFDYLETGAMYRAFALMLMEKNISPSDLEEIEKTCAFFTFSSRCIDGQWRFFLGDRDVTADIRSQDVAYMASQIAPIAFIRRMMNDLQRAHAQRNNLVCEGRDIGTVVFPNADLKIFLTASVDVRAHRRFQEICKAKPHEQPSLEVIKKEIIGRDTFDANRELAPLQKAEDAVLVDTSDMDIETVVHTIIQMVKGT